MDAVDVLGGDMLGTSHPTLASYLLTPDSSLEIGSVLRNLL